MMQPLPPTGIHPTRMKRSTLSIVLSLACTAVLQAEPPAKLDLHQGDHVAIVGNALADRMQHDGTLEAFIHKAHPKDDISIRNLGFAADEVTSHMRSDSVPTTEDFLAKAHAEGERTVEIHSASSAALLTVADRHTSLARVGRWMMTSSHTGPRYVSCRKCTSSSTTSAS